MTKSSSGRTMRWASLPFIFAAITSSALDARTQPDTTDRIRVTLVGDLIAPVPISKEFAAASPSLAALLANDTATYGNFEGSAFDLESFEGSPQAESGGSWIRFAPEVPKDLARMGFDLVSRANNHATDWGVEGLRTTDMHLDEAGLVHSGTGKTLSAASSPAYLATSKGRVALVSMTTTFTPMSPALDPAGTINGRAGVNSVQLQDTLLLDKDRSAQLAAIGKGLSARDFNQSSGSMDVLGQHVELAARAEDVGQHRYVLDPNDLARNLKNIAQARATADLVIVSVHAHEGLKDPADTPQFLRDLAHSAIDAGADIFVSHGTHRLRGIEIYHGRPIFYSLGNFVFMENHFAPLPAEFLNNVGMSGNEAPAAVAMSRWHQRFFDNQAFFDSVAAEVEFVDGRPESVRLYPIDLQRNASAQSAGLPKTASPQAAARILKRIGELSAPFGTRVENDRNVGMIRLTDWSPKRR